MTDANGRIIKRYANRKLYDTQESRYVTLDQISAMIRTGEEVKVIDNNSKEDLTSVTLAQIIFEEEKKQHSFLPLAALRKIIQSGGESIQELMSQLSESAERVGRVFRHESTESKEEELSATDPASPVPERSELSGPIRDFMDSLQKGVEEWQKRLESNIHHAMENMSPLAPLQKKIQALWQRLSELERKVGQVESEPLTPTPDTEQKTRSTEPEEPSA